MAEGLGIQTERYLSESASGASNVSDLDQSSSAFSMDYSSSPFEGNSSDDGSPGTGTLEPYSYEPDESSDTSTSSSDSSSDDENRQDRLANTNWCTCGNCVLMPTPSECVCCQEITATSDKTQTSASKIGCITSHEGFEPVCLNVWVLQAGFAAYRFHYGTHDVRREPLHEQYRFIAYRQLVGWCWGWLGRSVRVILPSCAVHKIRTKFPSTIGNYTGFKYPTLS